jgi:hypothetical protein
MRRAFSIVLVLFFGLLPLAATLSASDDSRLPPCCRRNGAHHCAMSGRMAAIAAASSNQPTLIAPATCPYFPGYAVAPSSTVLALATPIQFPALLEQAHKLAAIDAAAPLTQIRTRAGRGPPNSPLAS